MPFDDFLDPLEQRAIEAAMEQSLLDQAPGSPAQPSFTTSATLSPTLKRRRIFRDSPSPPSKRFSSPTSPSDQPEVDPEEPLYPDLLQDKYERRADPLAFIAALKLGLKENWQHAALRLARSEQLQMVMPGLADEGLAKYRNGALRITRTPGRKASGARNCIELGDVLKKESMLGAFISSFLFEDDFFQHHLPIEGSGPHSRRDVPLYISRDRHGDPLLGVACVKLGVEPPNEKKRKLTKADGNRAVQALPELWQRMVGSNYRAIYPYASGCVHSKVMVVRYPGFLLVVITSSNTMRIDMELGDNHWFIMAFPKLRKRDRGRMPTTEFERDLLRHMEQLGCPDEYLDTLAGCYDFSAAKDKVELVSSVPGTQKGDDADEYGALRLASLVKRTMERSKKDKHRARDVNREFRQGRVELEICAGSVGTLDVEWVKRLDWALKGRDGRKKCTGGEVEDLVKAIDEEEKKVRGKEVPSWTIVFPTKKNVKACDESVRQAASNIGCSIHTAKFPETDPRIKAMFHDYLSKDAGMLFHQKFYLWLSVPKDKSQSSAPSSSSSPPPPPYLLYLGSHNLSRAAWGHIEPDNRKSGVVAPHGAKLTGLNNYELGVVVRGEDVMGMLEEGSESWEEIVTYERPAKKYEEGDTPWNSPAWVDEARAELRAEGWEV
ncbi:hypothetical protein JCM8097_006206 [Rhodosporidiobolus ruineniae]